MEAFAKKKGKEGTRGSGQILKENVETLTFYRNMFHQIKLISTFVKFVMFFTLKKSNSKNISLMNILNQR